MEPEHDDEDILFTDDDWMVAPREDDIIRKPRHYAENVVEPVTFIMANGFEFWRGNIIKYAARAGKKIYDGKDATESEVTDLQKVIRYAEMRINMIRNHTAVVDYGKELSELL